TPQFAVRIFWKPMVLAGKGFNLAGRSISSASRQARPSFFQAGPPIPGRAFPPRWAEIFLATPPPFNSGKDFICVIKARAAKAGRDPDQMKILPGMVPIVAETKAMAEDKRKLIDELADPLAGLSTLSYHLDIDLSQFPQDRVLPTLDVPGVQGHYKEV